MSANRKDNLTVLLLGLVIAVVLFAENQQSDLGLVGLTILGLAFLRAVLWGVRLLPDNALPATQSHIELQSLDSIQNSITTITSEMPRLASEKAGLVRSIIARMTGKRSISIPTQG